MIRSGIIFQSTVRNGRGFVGTRFVLLEGSFQKMSGQAVIVEGPTWLAGPLVPVECRSGRSSRSEGPIVRKFRPFEIYPTSRHFNVGLVPREPLP